MLTIVNKKTWRTSDFPVWERVKHIVPVLMCTPPTKQRILAKSCTLYTSNYGNIINEAINGRGNKTSLAVIVSLEFFFFISE